jgi:hypothetical protein
LPSRLTFNTAGHAYKIDGHKVPSVTQLMDQLGKPALVQWAANMAADYATDNWDNLQQANPSERRKRIASAHRANRDRAAAQGTAVHALAELLITGQPIDVPEQISGYVGGLARWLERTGVVVTVSEAKVWTDHDPELGLTGYAGTFDAIVKHPRHGLGLVDWKTGSGIYGNMGLQLAGYRAADNIVLEGEDRPMPRVEWVGAVHIQPDMSELHILPEDQARAAADRFTILRLLALTADPEFRRDVA